MYWGPQQVEHNHWMRICKCKYSSVRCGAQLSSQGGWQIVPNWNAGPIVTVRPSNESFWRWDWRGGTQQPFITVGPPFKGLPRPLCNVVVNHWHVEPCVNTPDQ